MKTKHFFLALSFLLYTTSFIFPQGFESGMLYIYIQDENAIPEFDLKDDEIEIILQDESLKSVFELFEVFSFERAFPIIDTIALDYKYELDRVYILKCSGNEVQLMQLLLEEYNMYYDLIELIPSYQLTYSPNDYHILDNILGPNYALDIINAKQAWDITQGDPSVILGITDSGFWINHEDIQNKIAFVLNNTSNEYHGTFVAGIAAAETDNNLGMSSIGFKCKLGLGLGSIGSDANTGYNTLIQMANMGVKVANASWASLNYSQTHQNMIHAMTDLGLLLVAAAGNGDSDEINHNLPPHDYRYPASYDRVLSVTSVGSDLSHYWSDAGITHTHNDKVDVSAPGYSVISTSIDPAVNYYWKSSGTSFAAPYVTGMAGLILSLNPDLLPHQLTWIIKSTAQNIDQFNEEYIGLIGTGLIDAYAAVLKAEQFSNTIGADYDILNGQNIVWDAEDLRIINNYIHVHQGGTLTINGVVFLKENAIIIVDRGGVLSLDGAYLSSYDLESWHGIEVWGDYDLDQNPQSNKGVISINNGTLIENATYALTIGKRINGNLQKSFGGGIVFADDVDFRNNGKSVEFSAYQRDFPPFSLPNMSYFYNCRFLRERNTGFAFNNVFITLNAVQGINIFGCSFINNANKDQVPLDDAYGIGILSNNSSFAIETFIAGSEIVNPYFFGLRYGIKAQNISTTNLVKVDNSIFDKVLNGIYLNSCAGAVVTNNTFYMLSGTINPAVPTAYGLYMDYCTGYRVEYNNFLKWMNSTQPRKVIGIIVNNSGADYNMIYNNYFDKQYIGILAQNHNRGWTAAPYTGLVIKCNDFYRNHFDISVTGDDEQPHYGIGLYQGVPVGIDGPAGNLFGHWRPGSTSDYHNEMQHINYTHHYPSDPRLVPIYYTESNISLIVGLQQWEPPYSCPILLPDVEEEAKSLIAEFEGEANESKNILELLVDHGDTYQLETDVLFSNPSQSFDVYNNLLDAEGKLSNEVLSAAIQKEDVLVDAMIRDILVNNPHSVKSNELMFLLENRINQLPEFMLAQIDQGYNLLSSKEDLESNIAANELMAALLSNELIRIYKADTVNPYAAFDSLTAFLALRQTPGSYYRLAFEYLNAGQINDAAVTMMNIENFNLSDKQLEIYNRMITYFDLLKNIRIQDRNIYELQTEEVDVLAGLVNGNDMVSAYARSILSANNLLDYQEEIILPAESFKSSRVKRNAAMPDNILFIYPNPASDYFIASYNTGNVGHQSNQLVISDLTGRMVKIFDLGKHPSDKQIIPIQGINNGVYICTLFSNRQIISNAKLIVN